MQGNNFQIDKDPVLEIPIFKPANAEMKKVAALVDEIIAERAGGGAN